MLNELRRDCPMRHPDNGNCTVAGGFCTAVNDPICEALHNAYDCGRRSIDPESLRPKGECKYCSKEDKGALCWDCSDLGISVEFRAGRIRVTNEDGDEAYLSVSFCPNCGADMREVASDVMMQARED